MLQYLSPPDGSGESVTRVVLSSYSEDTPFWPSQKPYVAQHDAAERQRIRKEQRNDGQAPSHL